MRESSVRQAHPVRGRPPPNPRYRRRAVHGLRMGANVRSRSARACAHAILRTSPSASASPASPTGWLHVGGAAPPTSTGCSRASIGARSCCASRTPTSSARATQSESGVLDDLRWLGLDWDEGPDAGGPYRPLPPERAARALPRARRAAGRAGRGLPVLLHRRRARGAPRRGAGRRAAAALRRTLPPASRARSARRCAREARVPRASASRSTPRDWVLDDLVRGEVRFPAGMVGDFVLLRSSGLPTYNFACVVDDAGMRITHVIRAEEHLSEHAAPAHALRARWARRRPRFAHVPLILNRDRTQDEQALGRGGGRGRRLAARGLRARGAAQLPGAARVPSRRRRARSSSRAELLEAFTLERVGQERRGVRSRQAALGERALRSITPAAPQLGRWARGVPARAARAGARATARGCWRRCAATSPRWPTCRASWRRSSTSTLAFEAWRARARAERRARELCEALAACAGRRLRNGAAKRLNPRFNRSGKRLGIKGRELFQPVRARRSPGARTAPSCRWCAELLGRDRAARPARRRRAAEPQ